MTGSGSGQAHERIARHQQAADVMRARSILAVAFALWLGVGLPIDVLFHRPLGTGSLAFVVAARVGSSAYQWLVLALLYRRLAPPVANGLVASVFPISGFAIALIALRMGGIASPYAIVLCVGILVLGTAMPLPWKKGAALAGSTVAIYATTMLLGGSAQLANAWARDMFIVFVLTLGAGAVCVAWAGHVMWMLRRSVFESRNIGRYRLSKRIGKGGMGEVWRAQDRALRREVALKILSPEYGRQPSAIARFEREIQATAEIAHPNVIRIHDWGVSDDGVWYYAMDLLHGMDLATLVRQTGPLPAALVVHLGLGAAAGLAESHRRGVIHRDIKPGNMYVVGVDEPERIEVLDFGIARADTDSELTHAGAVLGTPGYMAPEVRAGAPGGVPADIYSLGAAFYYALTGRSPHDTDGASASALASVPAALDDLIVQMLDREPGRRPASVDAVVAALGACGTRWTGSWRLDQTSPPATSGESTAPTTVAGKPAPTPGADTTSSPTTVEG